MRLSWTILLCAALLVFGACVAEEETAQAPTDPTPQECVGEDCAEEPSTPLPEEMEEEEMEEEMVDEPDPVDELADCPYPEGSPERPTLGSVIPALSWDTARTPEGEVVPFSLHEFHCTEKFAKYDTLLFVVGTGWCPACPQYAQYVNTVRDVLEDEGALLVWYEAQNEEFEISTSEESHATIERYIGEGGPGIRVGDKDTLPSEGMIRMNDLVQAFPTQFIVRKSDMKIIATSASTEFKLPIIQIIRHPEANWDDPTNNVLPADVGGSCATDVDCDTGTLVPFCYPPRNDEGESTGWAGGYCTGLTCADDAACGEGNMCAFIQENLTACFKSCDREAEVSGCRPGYGCRPVGGIFGPTGCLPE